MPHTRRTILAGLAVGLATVACGPAALNAGSGKPGTAGAGITADATPTPAACTDPRAYVQFVVNVHDTVHIDESAATLLRATALFEKYGVAGDFYLTGPMVRLYAEKHPEVLERLKHSQMTVSYHVRPPHPLYSGFDQRLKGVSDAQIKQTLGDYETYGLNLATGDLVRGEAGGYTLVAETLGRAPVTVVAPNSDQRIKTAAWEVYRSLGAQVGVFFHETGTQPERPFEWRNGLLVRPSDFSVTRWKAGTLSNQGGDNDPFWWNMLTGSHAAEYNPAAYLKQRLAAWAHDRPALVTSLIHENNFARKGAEAWTLSYYSDTEKTRALASPFDLNAPDASKARSAAEQDTVWAAYEEMVAHAATNLRVVTSEDILALAAASGAAGSFASGCAALPATHPR